LFRGLGASGGSFLLEGSMRVGGPEEGKKKKKKRKKGVGKAEHMKSRMKRTREKRRSKIKARNTPGEEAENECLSGTYDPLVLGETRS